jgi:hypothetical protein
MNYEDIGAVTFDASERIAHRSSDVDDIYIVTECLERSALEKRVFRNAVLPSVIKDYLNGGLLQPALINLALVRRSDASARLLKKAR